jgi:biopolymer transport protein ExbD
MRLALHAFALTVALAAGCGDSAGTATSASATKSSTAKATSQSSSPKSDTMPILTVDDMGPYLNGQRANLKDEPGRERLKAIVAELPIHKKEVSLAVLGKAKVSDVVAVIHELGAAGAPSIRITSSDLRKDVPKEIVVIPVGSLTDKVPGCSVIAMVEKDKSTAVWAVKGGQGKKQDKGLAGPDLGNMGETVKKEIKKCDSPIAFFGSDPSLIWELAHSIGGSIMVNDEEKRIKTLVYLEETPVPGLPVKVGP